MVNYRVGLCLVIFLYLRKTSGLNVTEKPPSDSFVVSANYGVQSEHPNPNSVQNNDNSKSFMPNARQQYEGYPEHSLYVNQNYQDHSKRYLPTAQGQSEGVALEKTSLVTHQNEIQSENVPSPSGWQAVVTHHCSKHEAPLQNNHYYGSYGQLAGTAPAPSQQNQENYFQNALNRNERLEPPQTTSFQSYPSKYGFDVQHPDSNGYQGQNSNLANVVYGSSTNENQEIPWPSANRKILNEQTYEDQNNGVHEHQKTENLNDFHKPNVVELQEMINKIVKGNSKVHQVLKVPAVYEIHLQEDETPTGLAPVKQNNYGFHVPSPQWSTQKWQPHNQGMSSSPLQQRKKRPPSKRRPTQKRQLSGEGHHSTKTWNLPSKIRYFDHKDRLNDGHAHSSGKYAYPKPFSSTGNAKEIPLQQWYNYKGPNRHFDKTSPTVYGSVNVPMTPGSTEVTFLDYNGDFGYQNKFDATLMGSPEVMPDLSKYYAKQKELENYGFHGSYSNKNAYRRGGSEGPGRNWKTKYNTKLRNREERHFLPLDNLNYIFHVREKSRG